MKKLLLLLTIPLLSGCSKLEFNDCLRAFNNSDWPKALQVCREVAESGNGNAQFYLGKMYAEGKGVPQNSNEAIRWYKKAITSGVGNDYGIEDKMKELRGF